MDPVPKRRPGERSAAALLHQHPGEEPSAQLRTFSQELPLGQALHTKFSDLGWTKSPGSLALSSCLCFAASTIVLSGALQQLPVYGRMWNLMDFFSFFFFLSDLLFSFVELFSLSELAIFYNTIFSCAALFFFSGGIGLQKTSKKDLCIVFLNKIGLLFLDKGLVVVEYYHYYMKTQEVTPQ